VTHAGGRDLSYGNEELDRGDAVARMRGYDNDKKTARQKPTALNVRHVLAKPTGRSQNGGKEW